MSKIKSHFFFKTISILVIISICAVDIARAYPEYSASSHALAAEVMSQRTPMDPSIIPYRDQLYEKAELLGASLSIARYLLGDEETGENPLSKDYLESVMRRELGNAVEGVIFPDVAVENGIVSVPIDKDGKSFTIRVALVSTLTPRELAVYDLVAGEKYAVEFVTEDTGRDPAQPEKAITAVVSEPVTEISLEPAAEDSSAFEARTEKLPWWRVTKFTVRNILQSLALVLIVSQIAFAAGDSSSAEANILKGYLLSFYEFLKLYVTPYIDYAIGSPARYKGIALLPWLKFIGMIAPFGIFAANFFVRGLRYSMESNAEKSLKLHIVIARYCALHLSILMTILAYVNFRTGYPAIAYPAIAVLFTFMGSFMAAGWFYVKNNIPYNEKVMHAFLKEKCSWREIVSKAFMWEYEILYRHRPWGYPDINAVRKYIRKEYPSEPSVGLREHMVGLMGIGYGESVFHDTFDAVLRMEENGISKDTGRAYFNEIAQEAGLTLTSLSLFFEGWDCSTPAKTIESQNEFIISYNQQHLSRRRHDLAGIVCLNYIKGLPGYDQRLLKALMEAEEDWDRDLYKQLSALLSGKDKIDAFFRGLNFSGDETEKKKSKTKIKRLYERIGTRFIKMNIAVRICGLYSEGLIDPEFMEKIKASERSHEIFSMFNEALSEKKKMKKESLPGGRKDPAAEITPVREIVPGVKAEIVEANTLISEIISLARKAKRDGEKLIIGFETDWVPGYEPGKLQHNALNPLITEIKGLEKKLRSIGVDNVLFLHETSDKLAETLLTEAKGASTRFSNIIALGSAQTIMFSDSFGVFRNTAEGEKPLLVAVNEESLQYFYDNKGEDVEKQLTSVFYEILINSLIFASCKKLSITMMWAFYADTGILLFFPQPEAVRYEDLIDLNRAKIKALRSA